MIKPYLKLTKPGIIGGNLIAAIGGVLLASQGNIDGVLLLAVCIGTTLIVASGCVFNNVIDIDIDKLMKRTCERELVKKIVPISYALIWATILCVGGFFTLYKYTSTVAFQFGVLGFVVYVGLYSLYFKRKSIHGTLIGEIGRAHV